MAWKGVHLTKPAKLTLSNRQIKICIEEDVVTLPIEDVAWIVIDTPQATFTSALVSSCMESGIALVFNDQRHIPSGLLLPFHRHFRQGEVARIQTGISQPLKKRLWQAVVQAKIQNQAKALSVLGRDGSSPLLEMIKLVGSGDPNNVEARAARAYWSSLWENFRRENDEDLRNKMLNYGYAIIRAGVARALVAAGLLPAFGIQHASVTNAFNLADDLVEPFRPFVDVLVSRIFANESCEEHELTLSHRRQLANLLNENCCVDGETMTLLLGAERAAASLVRAMDEADVDSLVLPEFGT